MLISVVIPALNEEKYIGKTLEALVSQSHRGFAVEIIVVDNQSTDGTVEVVKKFKDIRLIIVPKRTPAYARQMGIEKANGEIVACLDADTVPDKNWLITIFSFFNNNPNLVGLTGTVSPLDGPWYAKFAMKYVSTGFYLLNFVLGKTIFQGQNFAVRKTAFRKIGGFNVLLHSAEDADLGNRLSRAGKVQFCKQMTVYTSMRRIKGNENIIRLLRRWPLAYLKVVWGINTGNYEEEPFPAVR